MGRQGVKGVTEPFFLEIQSKEFETNSKGPRSHPSVDCWVHTTVDKAVWPRGTMVNCLQANTAS